MVLDRRSALAAVLLVLAIAGCGGSRPGAAKQGTPQTTASSTSVSPQSSTPSTLPTKSPTSAAPSIVTNLCSAADVAQNAADTYMGALSAGNATQAMACVLPNTVPTALTRSLLAKSGTTAVYLPRDGADGPSVFGYQGNGKLIDVTVSKQPDGQFWVIKVGVRSG